jgi:hypothetical protein
MGKNLVPFLGLLAWLALGCGGNGVDSDEKARRAYLGLNQAVAKAISLGLRGFNSAQSANIDPQAAGGAKAGTLTVTGQVDQGSSANKGMRLKVGMTGYDDGDVVVDDKGTKVHIVYDSDPDPGRQPNLTMQLKNIPDGTLSGTLTSNATGTGVFHLGGDLKGDVRLDLTFTGSLQSADGKGDVMPVPGSTHVTGTATSNDGGKYAVDLTI